MSIWRVLCLVKVRDSNFTIISVVPTLGDIEGAPDEEGEVSGLPVVRIKVLRMRFCIDRIEVPFFCLQEVGDSRFHHEVGWEHFLEKIAMKKKC